jgi:hypothetical protein
MIKDVIIHEMPIGIREEKTTMSPAELIPFKGPRDLAAVKTIPPALFLAGPEASRRFWEFFAANIRNKNTRRAYYKAACRFSEWCERRRLGELASVTPIHVAAYIEELLQTLSKPSVKQHLAGLRMLFDWLVVGHIMDVNPAHAVRGPKFSQKKGKTPVLAAEEARTLLDAIDTGSVIGLRDRALIGLMVFTFARVGAARITSFRAAAAGCGCTKRAASATTCRRTTSLMNTWRRTSPAPGWPSRRAFCSLPPKAGGTV